MNNLLTSTKNILHILKRIKNTDKKDGTRVRTMVQKELFVDFDTAGTFLRHLQDQGYIKNTPGGELFITKKAKLKIIWEQFGKSLSWLLGIILTILSILKLIGVF